MRSSRRAARTIGHAAPLTLLLNRINLPSMLNSYNLVEVTVSGWLSGLKGEQPAVQISECFECEGIIDTICGLNWEGLNQDDLLDAARGYYYFSIQFRESLQAARELYPEDENLWELEEAECNTDNLSP